MTAGTLASLPGLLMSLGPLCSCGEGMSSALLRSRESYVGEQTIEVVFRPVDDGVRGLGSAPARLRSRS